MSRSEELFKRAIRLLPGGVSSPVRAYKPYPFYAASAKGSRIKDIDGREYIDYCMGYGPLILGHSHPNIKEAVVRQIEKGWLYGTPYEYEVALAERVAHYYSSVDMVRFVNTGTEATMGALRVARAYTGRNKIVKIEGGFHGAHEAVLVKAGSGALTFGTPDSLGIPVDFTKNTLQVPFNDIEALNTVIQRYGEDIAAVIMEPIMGNIGTILPETGYLKEVRAVTAENGIILIFDEIITGFRVAMGGAQEYYAVTPDMTTLGKAIASGFPIGIIGGKRRLMEQISPAGKVYQAGTFNANPVSLAAALMTIRTLERENVHKKINALGNALRTQILEAIEELKLKFNCSVSGIGSMFTIFFGKKPTNYQEVLLCNKQAYFEFFKRLLKSGIFFPPSQYETCFVSFAHDEADIEKTVAIIRSKLRA
ncbi:MAG: glutamate-1-semialdehyde 2,1-aminomutase [Methanocellales archaeon]